MKKFILLLITTSVIILSLQDCRHDPPVTAHNPNDPDSLYAGTPSNNFLASIPYFPFYDFSRNIPLSNPYYADSMTKEGIELGRRLFYDPRLSTTGQKSCSSCHKQQYAFSDSGNVKSTNVSGPTQRNAPALQNLLWAWSGPIFADGRVNSLSAQAQDALQHEQGLMDFTNALTYLRGDSTYVRLFKKAFGRPGDISEHKIFLAIQEFVFTLISYNSPFDKWQRNVGTVSSDVDSGFQVFLDANRGDCTHCHYSGSFLYFTNNGFNNDGLDNPSSVNGYADPGRGAYSTSDSNGYFKSPSLRNVGKTGPYMHDGRFATLDDVINFYSDSVHKPINRDLGMYQGADQATGKRHFTNDEKRYLKAFLLSLTDDEFLTDTAFSNPFH